MAGFNLAFSFTIFSFFSGVFFFSSGVSYFLTGVFYFFIGVASFYYLTGVNSFLGIDFSLWISLTTVFSFEISLEAGDFFYAGFFGTFFSGVLPLYSYSTRAFSSSGSLNFSFFGSLGSLGFFSSYLSFLGLTFLGIFYFGCSAISSFCSFFYYFLIEDLAAFSFGFSFSISGYSSSSSSSFSSTFGGFMISLTSSFLPDFLWC